MLDRSAMGSFLWRPNGKVLAAWVDMLVFILSSPFLDLLTVPKIGPIDPHDA
jgi:hypothetical protein